MARAEGEVAHRILEPEKCPLVVNEKICHFVSRKAFDIQGLGPKIIDALTNLNLPAGVDIEVKMA